MASTRYRLGSELRTEIRQATGYENNTHVTDDELDLEIDKAARLLLDLHLEVHGPEPYRATQYVTLADETSEYQLSQATYHVLSVLACKGTAIFVEGGYLTTPIKPYVEVPVFEEHHRLRLMNATYGSISDLRYRLGGAFATESNDDVDVIEVLPVPVIGDAAYLTITYVPQPTLDAIGEAATAQVFAPGGSSEWLVARVAAYIRTKEKDDPSPFLQRMAEVEARIRAAHSRKDANEPRRMRGRKYTPGRATFGDYAEDWREEDV